MIGKGIKKIYVFYFFFTFFRFLLTQAFLDYGTTLSGIYCRFVRKERMMTARGNQLNSNKTGM
ncbi:MAG: hypothetical protein PHC83_01620 [Bacteroidales bacterium]|jgi:hypothetical protein|nr:hypothetical protein [Bacteroidales bacterium]MDD4208763.1 hypothetical protein [Bacteroidales bacterium]MDY0015129.1 hypothetical protein [Bacteroidales bacterium]